MRIRIHRIWALCAVFGFAAAAASAQEVDSLESFWAWHDEHAETFETWRGDLKQEMNVGPIAMELSGRAMGKDGRQRMELAMAQTGMTITTVQGPDAVWIETNMAGQVMAMKQKAGGDGPDIGGPGRASGFTDDFDALKDTEDLSFGGAGEVDGESVYLLEVPVPQSAIDAMRRSNPMAAQMPMPEKVQMAVAQSDGFFRQIKMILADGSALTTTTLSGFETGIELDDALFNYEPPEGARVVDSTEEGGGLPGAPPAEGGAPPEVEPAPAE